MDTKRLLLYDILSSTQGWWRECQTEVVRAMRGVMAMLVVVAVGGCTATPAAPPPTMPSLSPASSSPATSVAATAAVAGPDWLTYSDNGVTFRYPPAWHNNAYRWASSFTNTLTYLSTVAVPDPCVTSRPSGSLDTVCGLLRSHLGAGDVLVVWAEGGGPAAKGFDALAAAPGTLTMFGGHAARVQRGPAGGECGQTGAVTAINALIALTPRPSIETVEVTACLGPGDQAANAAAVLEMLDTLRITA